MFGVGSLQCYWVFFFGACVCFLFFLASRRGGGRRGKREEGRREEGKLNKQPNNQTTRITPLHKAAAAQRSRSHFLAAFCQRDFSESWCLGPPGSLESPLLSLSPPHSLESVCVCVCVCVRCFAFLCLFARGSVCTCLPAAFLTSARGLL